MYNTALKYLETEVDEVRVVLLIDEENRQWYLNISLPKFGIVKCDEVFTSPLVVSANIACEIGYGPAAMMLYKEESPLITFFGTSTTAALRKISKNGPPIMKNGATECPTKI